MLKSVSSAYLIATAAILTFLLGFAGEATGGDVSVRDLAAYGSFMLIGLVSISFMTVSVLQHGISLSVIHWFFVLMFFLLLLLSYFLRMAWLVLNPITFSKIIQKISYRTKLTFEKLKAIFTYGCKPQGNVLRFVTHNLFKRS